MKAIYDRELRSHLNGMTGAITAAFLLTQKLLDIKI